MMGWPELLFVAVVMFALFGTRATPERFIRDFGREKSPSGDQSLGSLLIAAGVVLLFVIDAVIRRYLS